MKNSINLAFVLYKYFPFGGLQRDFLRIAQHCYQKGYNISVYTMVWEGEQPDHFNLNIYRPKAFSACTRNKKFHHWVNRQLQQSPADLVIGFNKMPGLDIYYAADSCYEDKARKLRPFFYRWGRRYRHFAACEHSVFAAGAATEILSLSKKQKALFYQYYGTEEERIHLLPPGIAKDRKRTCDADNIRRHFRKKHHILPDEKLLLLLGSGFITKGLDRALLALSALPIILRSQVKFFIVGKDKTHKFKQQAHKLKIDKQVFFYPGMEDVPALLQGADALIHPAYNENTGTVLLESLVAGLPVLCTDVCGYAHYIAEADVGLITPSPFKQSILNQQLQEILTSEKRRQWKNNAIAFSEKTDIYSMPERAAAIIENILNKKLRPETVC